MSAELTPENLKLPSYNYTLWVHDRLLQEFGGLGGVTKPDQILSALQRPKQILAYSEAPVDLYDLTASLCYGLAKNHGFVDGNKRTAFSVSMVFFGANTCAVNKLSMPPMFNIPYNYDIVQTMEDLVNNKITEHKLANIFRSKLRLEKP